MSVMHLLSSLLQRVRRVHAGPSHASVRAMRRGAVGNFVLLYIFASLGFPDMGGWTAPLCRDCTTAVKVRLGVATRNRRRARARAGMGCGLVGLGPKCPPIVDAVVVAPGNMTPCALSIAAHQAPAVMYVAPALDVMVQCMQRPAACEQQGMPNMPQHGRRAQRSMHACTIDPLSTTPCCCTAGAVQACIRAA